MPEHGELTRRVSGPARAPGSASTASLPVFSASPETDHRLSPVLRGGILQCLAYKALQPTRWIAAAFPSLLVRRG